MGRDFRRNLWACLPAGAALLVLVGCGGSERGGGKYSVTLAWDAPTTNADGTPLTDLAGYNVYDGETSGIYTAVTDVGDVTTFTLKGLPAGLRFFAVTAYDSSGNESDFSVEVSATLPIAVGDIRAGD